MPQGWVLLTVVSLFVFAFVAIERALAMLTERSRKHERLAYRADARLVNRLSRYLSRYGGVQRHLSELLESLQWPLQAGGFALLTLLLALGGLSGGVLLFQSFKGAALLMLLLAGLPYMLLRMALTQRQLKTRLEFLPAVELFYQSYLVTGGKQVRSALRRTIEERRLPGALQGVFEQLYRNLSVRSDDEATLRIFSASTGHVWGDYFVQIMRVALAEGAPVADNLKDLITDMRKARRANQQERNKLLEIRIANFSPLLFLALFIGINFRYNPEQAYFYYVLDPKGRDMLLNAAAMIFASFVMGLYLSRKKM
ncbi:type II secretion system F family protein [Paenibacillus sp. IB182496]|uniref:Type II secretion system F family protein n=2 Tax=Paenibacillus sabuli TaxID=2772509 RepID=A0A927BVU0_9BACL|nr:type II secretion system F family protein [Paenibacillus sabuli]